MGILSASQQFNYESADDFFGYIQHSLTSLPEYRIAYRQIADTFNLLINQQTASSNTNFVGPFAKTDYLLKEHSASTRLYKEVNGARARFRKYHRLTNEELKHNYLHDVKALAQFVSLVFGQDVPAELKAIFPAERTAKAHAVLKDYVRAIIERWDNQHVFCRIEGYSEGQEVAVALCPNAGEKPKDERYSNDWTYLIKMFYPGAQLNLIRPAMVGNELSAELIIFEPDYLVDVSTVARCFETYAESPFVNLVKKMQPSHSSEDILLGNFASQLLDEELHDSTNNHQYNNSVSVFFRTNAVNLLCTDITPDFHANAKKQQTHIHTAIAQELPRLLHRFDAKECIVEPSFFSEMLGLQGRMDMLQLDHRLVLEQKAGKGNYPYDNFIRPRHKEPHYVQLLLYMAVLRYNYHATYEQNSHEQHAFLLYSKYEESLLGLSFAPELLFRALKVRNGIAYCEMKYFPDGGFRLLEKLTPESLNLKNIHGTLWDRYTKPQLQELLSSVSDATCLEREYYLRFLTFISKEHLLAKIGNKTKDNSGFASKWHCSLEEKQQSGDIIDGLSLKFPDELTRGNVELVEFCFDNSNSDPGTSNFRVGDIVTVYPYNPDSVPDIRSTIVYRGTIDSFDSHTISVRLRAMQTHPQVFLRNEQALWCIEHDFLEASYSSSYRAVQAFLTAPQSRRDLLMLQRQPNINSERQLRGDYGAFDELSRRVKCAEDFFLIIGPPGTGKTSYGMLNTLVEELAEPESAVLLLSYTNRAVDEICSKLLESGIDFLRLSHARNTPTAYHPFLLEERLQQCNSLGSLRSLVEEARVIVATTTAINSHIELLNIKSFTLAIIDEASQILEPDLIGILSAHCNGTPAISKFVMIGDHKQLPAVVQQKAADSRVDNALLNGIGLFDCRSSLFERLLWKYEHNPDVTYLLTRQGRMHPTVARFVSGSFYAARLKPVPLPHQIEDERVFTHPFAQSETPLDVFIHTHRLGFLHVSPTADISANVNSREARTIAAAVFSIYQNTQPHFDPLATIGVIVPYRNQITAVRNAIASYDVPSLTDITIDTVERYQGSQRDHIIYGFTVRRQHQLNFLTADVFADTDGRLIDRKLNVALTRARRQTLLVGNAQLLSHNTIFSELITFIRNQGAYLEVSATAEIESQHDKK